MAWEASDDGSTNTILTLLPREDTVAPDPDLIPSAPINPQAEWQIGWTPPDPLTATSKYWLDQTTGVVYTRQDDGTYVAGGPPVPGSPLTPLLTSVVTIDASGVPTVRLVLHLNGA